MNEFISYLVYCFLLLWPFLLIIIFKKKFHESRLSLYLIAFAPTSVFASLRGNSGTDTENYRSSFDSFDIDTFNINGIFDFGVDPLFNLLIIIVKSLNGDFQTFITIQATLCLLLYTYGASKIDRTVPILGLGILPVLMIDSTFNGLRYGLAFATSVTVISYFLNSTKNIRYVAIIIPGLIHNSMLVLLALSPVMIVFFGLTSYFFLSEEFIYSTHFSNKQESYSEFHRLSSSAGIFPIIQFIMLYTISFLSKYKPSLELNLNNIAISIFIFGLILLSFTYASLRFLQLSVFLYAISVSIAIPNFAIKKIFIIIIALGTLGIINTMRQYFIVGPEGGVFFHPYDFSMVNTTSTALLLIIQITFITSVIIFNLPKRRKVHYD